MIANTVAEFSREAARRYLQSAVFIDDNIYDRATATLAAPEVVEARRPKPAIFDDPAALESTPLPETRPEPDPPFRTQDLVGSFAKHGIVCAPYEPERNFDTDEKSTVFQLCETVDLVILDWDFHEVGLTGGKPKDLIARLVKQSNAVAPHHVRLIAIYTTTPRLGSISSAVFDYLEQQGIPVQPEDNDELRLQCGSTRLVILGKPGPGRKEGEMTHVVEEKDLANWLLKEFAAMNRGILPSCALLGMAAVRMNSRRILDKFSARLDGQFLFHRSLVREDGEAFDQLPELLADEIRAAMEDSDMLPIDLTSLVSSALEDIQVHTVAWKIQETPAADFL